MFYFPSRIDDKIVKWYSDKGDYGYFNRRISYLAVVTYDEVIEVLFLSSTFDVLMSSECETEAEAMDVFDEPAKVKWHKMDFKSHNIFLNDMILGYFRIFGIFTFLGEFLWLLPVLLLFIGLIITFYPLYGVHTLYYHGFKYMIFIIISAGLSIFLLKQIIFDKQNFRIKEIIKLSLFSFILVVCLLYNGNLFLNVIYDCNNSPVNIELSEPYYYVSHHYRAPDDEYLTGYYNGQRYKFKVNGVPNDISKIINEQKSINVLFYEKSRSVKEISFNNDGTLNNTLNSQSSKYRYK